MYIRYFTADTFGSEYFTAVNSILPKMWNFTGFQLTRILQYQSHTEGNVAMYRIPVEHRHDLQCRIDGDGTSDRILGGGMLFVDPSCQIP